MENAMPLAGSADNVPSADWSQVSTPLVATDERREHYPFLVSVPMRWSDFDMMGHVNNVQFMRLYECAVVAFFQAHDVFPPASTVTAFAAENMCRFLRPLNYPMNQVDCGMRVERMGKSSVRFGFALFRKEDEVPASVGYWVHVFIDRMTMRPALMPQQSRDVFTPYLTPGRWTATGSS